MRTNETDNTQKSGRGKHSADSSHSRSKKTSKKRETIQNDDLQNGKNKNKKHKGKKIAIIVLVVILVILIILAILFAIALSYINNTLGKLDYDTSISEEDIVVNTNVAESISNYRNIVLFGIDARSDTFSLGNRSDCIILVTINNTTHDVALTSVYRDTYLDIERSRS